MSVLESAKRDAEGNPKTEGEEAAAPVPVTIAAPVTEDAAVQGSRKKPRQTQDGSKLKESEFLAHPETTLCLANLHERSHDRLAKTLKDGINYLQAKKVYDLHWALLTFRTELQRNAMAKYLRGKHVDGKEIHICDGIPQSVADEEKILVSKTVEKLIGVPVTTNVLPYTDDVRNAVSPLWDMPYTDQLAVKQLELEASLRKMNRQFFSKKLRGSLELEWMKKAGTGACCPFEQVLPSPKIDGYRNKTEFTIATDTAGELAIGFLLGRFTNGIFAVGRPTECPGISEVAKGVAALVEGVLKESGIPSFDKTNHSGVWRRLMVRTSETGACLVELQYHPGNSSDPDLLHRTVAAVTTKLQQFSTPQGQTVTSFLTQEYSGTNNAAPEDTPRTTHFGLDHFFEKLLDISFRVSPSSFFQVNTGSAEVLCRLLRDWAMEPAKADLPSTASEAAATESSGKSGTTKADVVLLDVCCGTGTIGLPLAAAVSKVVGLEICESAVSDARLNAAANNIENCVYICGRAENTIQKAIADHVMPGQTVIGIVDPPREGLHKSVISTLRNCEQLSRLIYVSCNHHAWVEDALKLCQVSLPKAQNSKPFYPVRAVGVDLFPGTHKVELVVMFERLP